MGVPVGDIVAVLCLNAYCVVVVGLGNLACRCLDLVYGRLILLEKDA